MTELTPDILLNSYASGVFPMAVPEMNNEIYWFAPDPRTILPLDQFHVSRSLRRKLRKQPFQVNFNNDFEHVVRLCAEPLGDDEETWISDEIIASYVELHQLGFAHSVECLEGGNLIGGVYGVSLGGAFFGESMFHRRTDASKVALYYLVEHLKSKGFVLLDVQYTTDHLRSLGSEEISRDDYEARLSRAIRIETRW